MNPRRRCANLIIAAFALAGAGSALAHTALVKSEPARRATLSRPPSQVRLNERLEPEYATIIVSKDGSGDIATARARVDKGDPKLLVLDLPALGPGAYTVKYRVLSVDGHTVDYGYTFSVASDGAVK